MDERIERIVQGMQRLLKSDVTVFIAKVVKHDGDTCDVQDMKDTLYKEVRTIATNGAKGINIRPKIGSYVIVGRISGAGSELAVLMYSEIEVVSVTAEIVLNDGENGGMVKVRELERNFEQVKQYLGVMNNAIATALTATAAPGSAAASSTYSATMGTQFLNFVDMENTKVKH